MSPGYLTNLFALKRWRSRNLVERGSKWKQALDRVKKQTTALRMLATYPWRKASSRARCRTYQRSSDGRHAPRRNRTNSTQVWQLAKRL